MEPNNMGYIAILISIVWGFFLVLKSRGVSIGEKRKQKFAAIWSVIAMFIAGMLLIVNTIAAENVALASIFIITGFLFLIYKGSKTSGFTKTKVGGTKAKSA